VRDRVSQVEAVDVGLLDPLLHEIGDRRRAADEKGAETADVNPFRKVANGLKAASLDRGIGIQRGLN
jgi:hypothetical protein